MFNNIIYIIIVVVIFNINYPGEGLFRSPVTAILILGLGNLQKDNIFKECKSRETE